MKLTTFLRAYPEHVLFTCSSSFQVFREGGDIHESFQESSRVINTGLSPASFQRCEI